MRLIAIHQNGHIHELLEIDTVEILRLRKEAAIVASPWYWADVDGKIKFWPLPHNNVTVHRLEDVDV